MNGPKMMMRTLRTLLLASGLMAATLSQATHLVGGNLGYVYLGETSPGSQVYRYQVNMEFYLNCGTGSNFQSLYDLLGGDYGQPLTVGCYIQDPLNPNANKQKQVDVQVFLQDSLVIVPDLPDNCTIGQGLCAVKGTFVGTLDVPLNFGGYHLYYQQCCRNLDIDNLANPNGTGIGYYAFIPPPLVSNSSPVFLGAPTPYLCTNDTTTFLNSASDPDGDQLIFSFETPFNSVNFGGGIIPPPFQLQWPVPTVTYNGGFSVAQPFGAGGYSFINGATGLTQYLPPLQGNYVVSVEVKEFRNGQLIGVTRRDLQLQAIPCPPNATPQINTGQQISYSVNAGDLLCFDMDFLDLDGDSLTLVAAGLVFDPLVTNPPATIGSPVQGVGSVGSQFCWDTDCSQGQAQPYLFSVSVSDNGCPPKTIDVVVQVEVIPFSGPPAIQGPLQVCEGVQGIPYTVASIAGASFNWSVSGGVIASGGNGNTITVDWGTPGTGTVTVTATDNFSCTSSPIDVNVIIVALPLSDAGADTTLCAGGVAVLGGTPTGTSGSTFTWSPLAGLSSATTANPTATPNSTTSYIVQVTNSGCANRDTVVVSIALGQVDAGLPVTLCQGDTAQLNATGGQGYTWTPATGLSDPNIADPLAFPASTTTYTVIVTDSLGCSAVDSVTVTVNDPVNAGNDGSTTTCSTSLPILLSNLLTGNPDPGGIWIPSDTYTPGSGGGQFLYVVSGAAPCPNDTATITVIENTSPDAGQSATLDLCTSDGPVDLFPLLGPNAQAGGTWTLSDGSSFSGVFTPGLDLAGPCTYLVTGPPPCFDAFAIVDVTVSTQQDPGTDAALTVCGSGNLFNLTDSLGGTPATGGQWLAPNGSTHSDVLDPAVDVNGVYTYIVAGGTACADSATVTVSIQTPPADAGPNTALCIGDTVQLNATGGTIYAWTPGATLSDAAIADPFASPSATTTYVVSVTDGQGCVALDSLVATVNLLPVADAGPDTEICLTASITIGGSPTGPAGSSFLWTPSAGITNVNAANPTAQPVATITYTVLVTDVNQCGASDSVTVTVNPLPVLDAGADTSVCLGNGVQLNATGVGQFSWSPATGLSATNIADPIATPTSSITYTATLTDGNSCVASDDVTVAVLGIPNADAGEDVWVCPGFDVQLNGTGGGNFAWAPISGLDDPTSASPLASPASTTIYVLTVTDGNGCTDQDNVTVTVNNDPPLDAGADQSICAGQQVQLGGNPTSVPGSTYTWTPAAGLDNASAANPIATPTLTTTYTLTVTNDTCTSSQSVLVALQGIAEPAFTVRLEPNCNGLRAFFTDLSNGASQWFWDFGDGSTSTEQFPQHEFAYDAPIVVTLTITDVFGCSGSLTQTYPQSSFADHTDFVVPNVFTPNGDGNNDLFAFGVNVGQQPDAVLGACATLFVYNRWGQKVFESLGGNLAWDGRTMAGEQCVTGTYFYVFTVKEVEFKGTVYLNR
jgi:gliding motility-associated-like protein